MIRSTALAATFVLALAPDQNRPIQLEAADCSQLNVSYGRGDVTVGRAVQHARVPVTTGALQVRPDGNGGVRVERGSGGEFAITACVSAQGPSLAEAQAAAAGVRLEVSGNRVGVSSIQDRSIRNWNVQLFVLAPDGASIDIETANGPIGVKGLAGRFALRASNGPISVSDVDGEVKARAANGPITIDGGRGTFDVETSNGPIGVRLTGRRWDGSLTARAQNGPLSLTLPADYQTGVEITSSGRSPWSCRAATWDESARTVRFGTDPVSVHLSTVNGPVTINER